MRYKARKFIDKTFGDEITYVIIRQNNKILLLDVVDGNITIERFSSINGIVRKYIEYRNTNNFFRGIVEMQQNEIESLEEKIKGGRANDK